MFKPEESSPPLTPEREAARQLLNDAERKILEAMESDLGRPLTEEEECLAREPGAVIEKPRTASAVSQLRAARAMIGWSHDQLAQRSGVSKPTIA